MAMGKAKTFHRLDPANQSQLFKLEGTLLILCAVYTLLYLLNYPQAVKFLSEDERSAILADLPEQAPNMSAKIFDMDQIKTLIKSGTFVPFFMI
jgi:hypothetical protein